MTQSGTTWLKTLSGLLPGDFVQYYFTYGWSAGGQNDSPVYTYFFNSSSSTSKSSSSSSIAATSSSSAQISSVKSISSSSSSMMPSSSSSSSSPATTGGIKIQMFNGTTALQSNTLNPQFQLVNSGSSIINLSQIKIRYYFTADGSQPINFWCDNAGGTLHGVYTSITSQVVGTIMKKSPTTATADTYLELSFNTGSIITLSRGQPEYTDPYVEERLVQF